MIVIFFDKQQLPFPSEEIDLSSPGLLPLQSLLHILCNNFIIAFTDVIVIVVVIFIAIADVIIAFLLFITLILSHHHHYHGVTHPSHLRQNSLRPPLAGSCQCQPGRLHYHQIQDHLPTNVIQIITSGSHST